jgi:hypothetical protein
MSEVSSLNKQVRWGAAVSLFLGMVAFAFSVSTLIISIPRIMAGLRADVDRLQWVVTSFDVTQTVVMPTLTAILSPSETCLTMPPHGVWLTQLSRPTPCEALQR